MRSSRTGVHMINTTHAACLIRAHPATQPHATDTCRQQIRVNTHGGGRASVRERRGTGHQGDDLQNLLCVRAAHNLRTSDVHVQKFSTSLCEFYQLLYPPRRGLRSERVVRTRLLHVEVHAVATRRMIPFALDTTIYSSDKGWTQKLHRTYTESCKVLTSGYATFTIPSNQSRALVAAAHRHASHTVCPRGDDRATVGTAELRPGGSRTPPRPSHRVCI
jgi:hypothetical protein